MMRSTILARMETTEIGRYSAGVDGFWTFCWNVWIFPTGFFF